MTRKPTMFSKNPKRAIAEKTSAALCVFAALCIVSGVSPALAGDGDGGTQSVFSLGAGSRGISLGRAFSTLADDASAIYWNPAALRNVQTKQLSFMYMPLYGDFTEATYMTFGLVYPTLNAGAFGLGFMRVSSTFDRYDEFSRPLGEGEYSESQMMIGYAFERSSKWIAGRLATGASFKIVNQKVDPYSSTAPGVDLGFRYIPDFAKSLAVGVNFQDLVGADHKLDAESDRTARTIMTGMGCTLPFSNGSALRLMAQYDLPEFADGKFRAGAEYAFSKYVALRVGMDDSDFSFGLGVTASTFGLDYAMLSRETAGSSHPVTFTASYGSTLDEQRQAAAAQRAREDQEVIRQAFNARVKDHRDRAIAYEAQGNLAGAVDEWKIVLDLSPGDADATARLSAVTVKLVDEQEKTARDREKQREISARFAEGLRLYQENDYARSREEWRAILAVDSTHAEAADYLARTQTEINKQIASHSRRAGQLEQSNRFTEAVSEWNNVESLDPGNRQAKAAVERIRRRIEEQSQNLEQASRKLEIVNLYDTALQAFNQGQYDKAISDLDRLLVLEPGHEEAKNLRAMAKRKITPLSKQEEDEVRRLFLRGMQHFAKDEYQKAIEQWQKILEIDPTNESVKRNIEEAKERLKQLEERG
jgi:cytochrome c-type biogenesis protein CcmH/NrfG